jgi:hypothetical protein
MSAGTESVKTAHSVFILFVIHVLGDINFFQFRDRHGKTIVVISNWLDDQRFSRFIASERILGEIGYFRA